MPTASPRERLLEAAAEQLTRDGELSTRAVCDAAGVGAPTLYHHFGDKDGLIEAAIAVAYESNLSRKRARKPSADPVDDVRRGWNEYVQFASEHPGFYRLMYAHADARAEAPPPAREARAILMREIARIAEAGRLRVEPELAAEVIGTAVRGVGAMAASAPETPLAGAVNDLIREAVLGALFTDAKGAATHDQTTAQALELAALVRAGAGGFSRGEAGLLEEWLRRLAEPESKETER